MLHDLARRWADKSSWTVLDINPQGASCFSDIRRARNGLTTGLLLHYVVVVHDVAAARTFLSALPEADDPAVEPIEPGMNRLLLDAGRVSLTVCVGPVSTMLTELRMQADTVFWAPNTHHLTDTDLKHLALNCHTAAHIYLSSTVGLDLAAFAHHGFQLQDTPPDPSANAAMARYLPQRAVRRSRRTVNQAITASRCAVIGAGLSGAAVAHALALRGWQVTVYDAHALPARGASGLPAGLCVAQTSSDDSHYARLSRQGVRLCLAHARRLLHAGTDWQQSGVLEKMNPGDHRKEVFHMHAAWLKPATLVEAWLSPKNIRFAGGHAVTELVRGASEWILRGQGAQELGRAELVVFANAVACKALVQSVAGQVVLADDVLRKLSAMQAVHGSVSLGPDHGPPSSTPMNGSGSWIAGVPTPSGNHWYAGASYENDLHRLQDDAAQHAANLQRLRALSTSAAHAMAAALADNTLGLWRGTRCVTHDRLPLVGPLEATPAPGLWICAGMGSRGLSLAALCAELLAAYIHSEPLPLELALSKRLFVNRPAKGRKVSQTAGVAHPVP